MALPTDITLSNNTINDSTSIGSIIGTLNTIDTDIGDIFTYNLVSGTGDDDNSNFIISGNELLSNVLFNYEAQSIHYIRISTTDNTNNVFEKEFTINITDSIANLTDVVLSSTIVAEGVSNGTIVGTFNAINDDLYETHTFYLTDDADGRFKSDGNNLIVRDTTIIDYETNTSHDITVSVTDSQNNTLNKTFTITITDSANSTVIYSISPKASKEGTNPEITITGQHFAEGGDPVVRINGEPITINSYTDNEIKFILFKNSDGIVIDLEADVYEITIANAIGL